jgi:hypothetical protein
LEIPQVRIAYARHPQFNGHPSPSPPQQYLPSPSPPQAPPSYLLDHSRSNSIRQRRQLSPTRGNQCHLTVPRFGHSLDKCLIADIVVPRLAAEITPSTDAYFRRIGLTRQFGPDPGCNVVASLRLIYADLTLLGARSGTSHER